MATPKKETMTDEERQELIAKLNADLEEHVSKLERKPYKEGWSEDNWEHEMNEHPLFRDKPFEDGESLPPLIEALQQLKYDSNENTKEELAQNYKDDGNRNFKLKKYRWAIASYTEGLKQKCEDKELNAILYTNRAAAHYHLGNFRSALNDATAAKALKPTHLKAIVRGVLCLQELKHFDECIEWCKVGLSIDSENTQLLQIKLHMEQEKKKVERDRRKQALQERKLKLEEERLSLALKSREIQLMSSRKDDLEDEPSRFREFLHPAAGKAKLHLDDKDRLIWPVMFLYPEYGESDFIAEFHEDSRFCDHLEVMFGSVENKPEWDQAGKYFVGNIQMYYKSQDGSVLEINPEYTLAEFVYPFRTVVFDGVLEFIVTTKDSPVDIKNLENL